MTKITFNYSIPVVRDITYVELRKTLAAVRDELLTHGINGGSRKLKMDIVCQETSCGTAACIGGWTSIFLLGFDVNLQEERNIIDALFNRLIDLGKKTKGGHRLSQLFYHFHRTDDYNIPNIAATAINRYLNGREPWPIGVMPKILPYTTNRALARKKATKKK